MVPTPLPPPPPPDAAADDLRELLMQGESKLVALWGNFDQRADLTFVYSKKLRAQLPPDENNHRIPVPVPETTKIVFVTTSTNRGGSVAEERTEYANDVVPRTMKLPYRAMKLTVNDLVGHAFSRSGCNWTRVLNLPEAQVQVLPKLLKDDVLARALDLRQGDVLFQDPTNLATARVVAAEPPLL